MRRITAEYKQIGFFGRRPLPFGGSHLRLPSGPAGIRTTTGSLSAEYKQTGVNVAWNVSHINVFIPAWMLPPVYHSLQREETKSRHSGLYAPPGLRMKPLPKLPPNLCTDHAIIKEDVTPSATTWHCNRPYINLKQQ